MFGPQTVARIGSKWVNARFFSSESAACCLYCAKRGAQARRTGVLAVKYGVTPFPKKRCRYAGYPGSAVLQNRGCRADLRRGAVCPPLLGNPVSAAEAQQERDWAAPLPAARGGTGVGNQAPGAWRGVYDFGRASGIRRDAAASEGPAGSCGGNRERPRGSTEPGCGGRSWADQGRVARDRGVALIPATQSSKAEGTSCGPLSRVGESFSALNENRDGTRVRPGEASPKGPHNRPRQGFLSARVANEQTSNLSP